MLNATQSEGKKTRLLPTPPVPDNLPPVELTENANSVFTRRYVRKDEDGQPAETLGGNFLACGLSCCQSRRRMVRRRNVFRR